MGVNHFFSSFLSNFHLNEKRKNDRVTNKENNETELVIDNWKLYQQWTPRECVRRRDADTELNGVTNGMGGSWSF